MENLDGNHFSTLYDEGIKGIRSITSNESYVIVSLGAKDMTVTFNLKYLRFWFMYAIFLHIFAETR